MIKYVCLVALSALAGCHTVKPAPAPTVLISGCEHFKMISASRQDTKQTRTEIQAHNAEYIKVCQPRAML